MPEFKMGIADIDLVLLMHIIANLKSAKHNLHLMRAIVSEYEDFLFSAILSVMYLKMCEVMLDMLPVNEKTRGVKDACLILITHCSYFLFFSFSW